MALAKQNIQHTINEIYNLPEGQRAELIDGDMYMVAPPNRTHQKIVSVLHAEIYKYIEAHNGSCEVYPAPFAVFLNADDKNYVEPDISVICDRAKLNDKGCSGVPIGLLRSFHQAVKEWIILLRCSNIIPQA